MKRQFSRRQFLATTAAAAATSRLAVSDLQTAGAASKKRRYHLCMPVDVLEANPGLVDTFREAGVDQLWLAAFFYGFWPYPREQLTRWRKRIMDAGMAAEYVNIPLGHPGDSLGSKEEAFPLTPPEHWRMAVATNGATYSGTSLHAPATTENAEAIRVLDGMGARTVFLDDDFRLARGPGVIGGCFCDEHKRAFLDKGGFDDSKWDELLADIASRNLTSLTRAWVESTCDQLTGCFRAQQEAAPNIELGNMIMYLGAEKAGIRLADYKDVPVRVGELMFNDASFQPTKGKTNELFSALFHRRFVRPELAYSETTAFPADKLSVENLAAKLVVSTIADVRNTMFMSGVTPFPFSYWDILPGAMQEQAAMHRRIAGHQPAGPLKHYWGEASRYVGDDNPYSLFLALGVPFEVTDSPAEDGWTFLSDADAAHAAGGQLASPGTTFVGRTENGGIHGVPEDMAALFEFRRGILPSLNAIPHVVEEKPAVCAWYPEAGAVLVWNLAETAETLHLQFKDELRETTLGPLEAKLVDLSV